FERVYVDFDDAIISDQKVNHLLLGLLYSWANQGKEIIMITKHAHDIQQTLAAHKVAETLFDEIVHITHDDEKSTFIKPNSIFIDDSFSERKEVHAKLGIPVFDISEAVELL